MSTLPTFADEARGPWSRWQSIAFDAAVVVAVMFAGLATFSSSYPYDELARPTLAVVTVQALPLLVRRVRPAWCVGLVALTQLAQLAVTHNPTVGQVAVPITLYSAAAFGARRTSVAALGIALVGSVLGPADWGLRYGLDLQVAAIAFVGSVLVVISSWTVGALASTRQKYVEQLIDRGIRLERDAAQRAELAASDERARIAREMHDVVAHGLSVMVVQADGARYQLEKDPERAGRALETIAATGRESLAEMRRMLGLLRSEDTETGTRPQPGLADLDYLLDQDHGPGITVEKRLDPAVAELAPQVGQGVGLTAYRVVQESLTNVRKHAGPGVTVTVDVRAERGRIEIDVRDDGRGAAAPSDGDGHGILGMRERVAVHGGRLDARPVPGGGFAVHASVPYVAAAQGALGEVLR